MVSNAAFEQAVLEALASLKTDVTSLKTDVTSLKAEVTSLKTDVTSLKGLVTQLDVRLTQLEKQVFGFQSSMTRELREQRIESAHRFLALDTRVSALELSMADLTHAVTEIQSTTVSLLDVGVSVSTRLREHDRRLTAIGG